MKFAPPGDPDGAVADKRAGASRYIQYGATR
jgi:hypothetical protein